MVLTFAHSVKFGDRQCRHPSYCELLFAWTPYPLLRCRVEAAISRTATPSIIVSTTTPPHHRISVALGTMTCPKETLHWIIRDTSCILPPRCHKQVPAMQVREWSHSVTPHNSTAVNVACLYPESQAMSTTKWTPQ